MNPKTYLSQERLEPKWLVIKTASSLINQSPFSLLACPACLPVNLHTYLPSCLLLFSASLVAPLSLYLLACLKDIPKSGATSETVLVVVSNNCYQSLVDGSALVVTTIDYNQYSLAC